MDRGGDRVEGVAPSAQGRCLFPHQVEIDTTTAKLGEITLERGGPCLKLHPHWQHSFTCEQPGTPDLAGILIVTRASASREVDAPRNKRRAAANFAA
jgi:hypothetical protein